MASTQRGHKHNRPTIFLVGCILLILLGAGTTLLWQTHSERPARAASGDVVGPPTLPAATVDAILTSLGSPMAGTGAVIEQASRQTNIDDAFALAVWWTETNDGAAGVGFADRNPGSVRGSYGYPAAFDGYTIYSSYAAGINDWFNIVRTRYVDRGLTSAYTICYPYVGTSSSYQWAIKVVNLMLHYHDEAPPPPTPTPSIPTPNPVHIQHVQVHVVNPQPDKQGKTREAHVSGNVIVPVVATPQPFTSVPVHSTVVQASSSLLIILSGLLAALLIALWGIRIGRFRIIDPPPATTPLPALYGNEFSPVLMTHTEPLFSTPVPQLLPATPVPQPVPVFSNQTEGGLLKRYANTDVLPKKVRLRSATIADEPVPSKPFTENQVSPDIIPQGKTPEPVGANIRPAGLLRRYSMERYSANE